jgi:hypothetical protein
MEPDSTHPREHQVSPKLREALAALGVEARQAITDLILLHRDFPAWAVWPPPQGEQWTAIRPASGRAPAPDLPMAWVLAATAAELSDRMAAVDAELIRHRR